MVARRVFSRSLSFLRRRLANLLKNLTIIPRQSALLAMGNGICVRISTDKKPYKKTVYSTASSRISIIIETGLTSHSRYNITPIIERAILSRIRVKTANDSPLALGVEHPFARNRT